MKDKTLISFLFVSCTLLSCTKSYNCADPVIRIGFIGFKQSDLDTLIVRQFKANTNFQTLIDTNLVMYQYNAMFTVSNDTITMFSQNPQSQIRNGYDWLVYIPAKNRTVAISNIVGDHKTGGRNWGIFSLDPGPPCINDLFTAKVDSQQINIPKITDTIGNTSYYLFINN